LQLVFRGGSEQRGDTSEQRSEIRRRVNRMDDRTRVLVTEDLADGRGERAGDGARVGHVSLKCGTAQPGRAAVIAEYPAAATAHRVAAITGLAAHHRSSTGYNADIGNRRSGQESGDGVGLDADCRTRETAGEEVSYLRPPGFAARAGNAGSHLRGGWAVRQAP
jgi:hypothetical protein